MFGDSQVKVVEVAPSVTVRFLGAPIVFTIGGGTEVKASAGIICIDPD